MADKCNTYNNVLDDLLDIMCSEHKGRPFYNICRNHHRDYIEGDNENKLHSKNLKDLFLQNIVMGYINANYQEIFNETSTQIFLKNLIKSNEDCSIPTPYCGGENANELEIETCLNATNAETKIKEIRCPNKKLPGHTDNDNGFNGVRYDNDPYSEENKDCQILHNVLKKNCFIQNSPDFIQNKEAFKKCIYNYGDEFISNIIHNNKDKDNNIDREKLVCLNEKIIKVINENLEDFINLSANDNLLLNGGGTSYTNTDFDMVDTDNDTVISSEELINYENSKTKRLNFFDADKDGEIDATEWPMNNANFNFVNQSGSKINNDELIIYQEKYEGNREFQFYDINNDGSISEVEWDKDKDKSMKDYNYDRIKELLYKKLREEIESEGKNFNDYIADDIHYNGSNFKDVILSGSLKHIKNKFIEYRDDLCSIRIDTINEGSNILPIDDIKYGKIGTADGLYGKIGDTYGSYGLIGDKQDDYISINNCISNTEINDSKTDVFKDILLKVKDRNDDFIKLVNDNDIYSTSNIYLTSNNYLNEYSDRYLNEISYDNFTKLNIYNDYILNNDYDYKSSKMAEIDNYYNDYSERINKYPDSTIECKHIDDYNDLNVCRNSEETCTPNLISEDRIDESLEPKEDDFDFREKIFLKSLEPKEDDLRQYIFHNQSNIYVDKQTIIDGLTWTKVSTRPNIGLEISEIINNNQNKLDALIEALNKASESDPEQITIDDTVYGNNSIDLNKFDNNTYWEKSTDVYYKLNIRHDSCRVPSNYKQQNSEDICGEEDMVCAYKNQYENSIKKISRYTDESECPMSCEDKLSNLDYCYNNVGGIKAELEKTFVDYTTCEDDNSNDPTISPCNPIKECDIGYFREFIKDSNDSYTCEIDCTQCTNKPDNNSHYISSNNCDFECNYGFEYNLDYNVCYILCPAGQKRISQNTCEYCPADEYKDTISTSTTCTPCPFGSTTNGNTGSTSINSCVARPGYEEDDNDNQYTLKPGNFDDIPSGDPDGTIDRCDSDYYYNAGTNECISCDQLGDGIECTGGDIIDQTNYPKRKLKNGYGLSNNTSYPCQDEQYRKGDIIIDYNDTSEFCNICPIGSTGNNNTTDIPNDDCIIYPGYKFTKDESIIHETTLEPGNFDNIPSGSPDGIIDRCDNDYYYNAGTNECETCGNFGDGIECTGGDIIDQTNYPKRKLKNGYGLSNNTSYPCHDEQYRKGDIVIDYDVTSEFCNICPIGSTGNNNTTDIPNDDCIIYPGYKFTKDESIIHETTLEPGYNDNETPIGYIDGCKNNYYYDDTYCLPCNYGDGVKCDGGTLDTSNRMLQPGYSWDGTTAQPCSKQYRLGEVELQDNTSIDCNSCPIGTSYDGNNGCELNKGYSWSVDANGNSINITNNLYNDPLSSSAYYYVDDEAIAEGCTSGYYNIGGDVCSQCPIEGIECTTDRPFEDANMTLKPNYSWDQGEKRATKCPNGYKQKGNIAIDGSDITCDPCDDKPDYSEYDDSDGNQLYNSDGSCQWSCDSGYQRNNDECLKECYAGEKRNESSNTCEPCEADYYKETVPRETHTDTTCSPCPIGSTTNSNTGTQSIGSCTARPGYEYSEGTYKPKEGNIDNEPDGYIDNCEYNFYYDSTNGECVSCVNYGNGIDCTGGPINASKRMLQSGYSWDSSTAEPCDVQYRLGKVEVQDGVAIDCTSCPTGTSYDNDNGCDLNTGYSWPDTTGEKTNNLYNNPDKEQIAYYYDDNVAQGCTSGHYNDYNTKYNDCTQCPDDEGIDCSTNRPFDQANMTLRPNYSWNNTYQRATKCPKGYKREGNEPINSSYITCHPCDVKPSNSDYLVDEEGNQLYNSDGSCQWSCDSGYQRNNDECLKECQAGQKRNELNNTCEPCEADYYKETVPGETHTDTTCSPCPIGSTTNSNTGSQSIYSCTARPGYEDDDNDNQYTLKPGNLDDETPIGEIDGCKNGYYYNGTYCLLCNYGNGIACPGGDTLENSNRILQPDYSWIDGTAQSCGANNIRPNTQEILNIDDGDITCSPCPSYKYKDNLTCSPIPIRHYKKSDGDITEVPANRISSGNIGNIDNLVTQIILEYTGGLPEPYITPTIDLTYQNNDIKSIVSVLGYTDVINNKIYYDINTLAISIKIEDIQDISIIDNDEIIITKIIAKTDNNQYYLLAEPQHEGFTNYNFEGFADGQHSIYNKQQLYENTTEKECPSGTYVNVDANVCQYPNDGQILSGNNGQDCPYGSIVNRDSLFDNSDCGYAISGYYTTDNITYSPCMGNEYQDLEGQNTCKPVPEYDTNNISTKPYTLIKDDSDTVNIGVQLKPGYSYDTTNNITECPLNTYREQQIFIDNRTDITCTPCDTSQITFNKASTSKDNCIDQCLGDYYFNGTECETCGPFGNGIECPGGDLNDEAHRYLKEGYRWTGLTSELCEPGYYRGNDTTQGPQVYDNTAIPCDECPTGYSINYTPSPDNLITSDRECLYDVCGDNEYRDDSNTCQPISLQNCTADQIHFSGIAENNENNTGYPASGYITYDDITARTYESYDSTCYPGETDRYFVAKSDYSQFFQ